MRLYMFTDQSGQTYNQTQWGENVTHQTSGWGEMCGPDWLHAYTSPLLAVLLNPVYVDIQKPQLWEAEGEVMWSYGYKVGTTKLTTIKQIPLPKINTEQRVTFAILCALEVYKAPEFATWANRWLSGADRTVEAASWADEPAVAWAAEAAARADEPAAAAWAAALAAEAASRAAKAVCAVEAAREAASAAAWAASAAAWAASNRDLRLGAIADKAIG